MFLKEILPGISKHLLYHPNQWVLQNLSHFIVTQMLLPDILSFFRAKFKVS